MRNAFIMLVLAGASFTAGRLTHRCDPVAPRVVELCDTITRTDTLRVRVPEYVERPTVRTVTVRDTVTLPAVTRVYEDTTFRAVVSGIDPRLDSMTLYPQVRTVTRTLSTPPRRWGLGITAGLAVTPRGLSPALTVGVTYTIPWP